MDLNSGNPVDLSLDDFEDEDLSEILHENELQHHSYSNDNFKICRKLHAFQRRRQKSVALKKKDTKQLHRSQSVSDTNNSLKGTLCRRPRPTTLNFFAAPARPGPLPACFLVGRTQSRDIVREHCGPDIYVADDIKIGSRLKPTFSDETIKNNNVKSENTCSSQTTPIEKVENFTRKDETAAISSKTNPTGDASNPTSLSNRHSLPRRKCNDVTQATRCTGLTRSASEWSIDDPDKVEYCYVNGEFKEQTHSALFKFVPRHQDEISLEINDPLHVSNQADDFWFEGINMRTGQQGIFPSYYAQSLLDYVDKLSDISLKEEQSAKFNIYFLGSVEVSSHKGNDVLCQAMHKVAQARRVTIHKLPPAFVCLLVSSNGIKMMDQSRMRRCNAPDNNPSHSFSSSSTVKQHSHYFHLRNVSFCGHHPKNDKYFAFITRHPQSPSRFACHVFVSDVSTRPLAESIGRAFDSFYQEFMNNSHPVEDIYIE